MHTGSVDKVKQGQRVNRGMKVLREGLDESEGIYSVLSPEWVKEDECQRGRSRSAIEGAVQSDQVEREEGNKRGNHTAPRLNFISFREPRRGCLFEPYVGRMWNSSVGLAHGAGPRPRDSDGLKPGIGLEPSGCVA